MLDTVDHPGAETRIQSDQPDDAELRQIARGWGWRNPPKAVLDIARQALLAQTTSSEQLLVDMGVVTEEQKTRWLAKKPDSVEALKWFADQEASIAPYVERVQALTAGHPFYVSLSALGIHPCMQDASISKRADELDATVMLIEETTPVIVFSTNASLIKFRSLGRGTKANDPIVRLLGSDVQIAAGARDEISSVLTAARSSDESFSAVDSSNIWSAAADINEAAPENRLITRLIDHALSQGATDVALEPMRNGEVKVRMRKFGEMISPKSVPSRMSADMGKQVIALLQSKSGANPTATTQRGPTDGQITYRSGSGDVFLRLSFIPLMHLGEIRNLMSVSIRLLPRAETNISLHDLKISEKVVAQIRFAMRMSQGLVLVVGPTNSGKSTTVAGAIGQHVELFGDLRKRLSAEEPIERHLHGILQFNVPPQAQGEFRFEALLRAFKRHDPDMLWIGEIRDRESADTCVRSASTGHLVLSTMHANDPAMAIDVLAQTVDAGMRSLLIECMSFIMSQRLIKELCPHCKIDGVPNEEEKGLFTQYTQNLGVKDVPLPPEISRANRQGCAPDSEGAAKCSEGYIGLLPIYEVLPFGRAAKDAAIEMLSGVNRRKELDACRTLTLLDSGLDLLAQGKVDLDAILV